LKHGKQKVRIYLDNCCCNRPYDDQSNIKIEIETKAKLFIQELILDDLTELVWSYVLVYENGNNPYLEKRNAIANWRTLSIQYVDESEELIYMAEEISKTGVKPSDALHVAAAISSKCDYFITPYKRILKHNTDTIIITDPIGFVKTWSGSNDE
jgi:predicted nucleic acid-binding protein